MTDRPLAMALPDSDVSVVAAVAEVVRSGQLSLVPHAVAFEHAVAGYAGARHGGAVSSGTAARHLCLLAAGVEPGDEVITSPFSFVASANCIMFCGARPIFADIEFESMNVDPAKMAAAVSPRTRALLPVHVFGRPCDMDAIVALGAARGLPLVEDACEALGSHYRGRAVGTFGQSAMFSFYPNKQITTGEGAVIVTDDDHIADKLRMLRNQGRSVYGGAWLNHEVLGYNYRMTEMSAALGASQTRRIDALLARRAAIAQAYAAALSDVPGVRLMNEGDDATRFSWFAAIARLDEGIDRNTVIGLLERAGVPARAYFAPIHLQPFYRETYGYAPGDFPVAERVARSTLALPFHGAITPSEIARVCDALHMILSREAA